MEKLTDLQEKYNDQDKYREDLRAASDMKPVVPKIIGQVVTPELLARINNAIDNAPMGLGSTIRTYLSDKHPEVGAFLAGSSNGSGTQQGVRDAPGQDLGQDTEEDRDSIPKERWNEILASMVEMDDEGISPGRISDIIFDDYGVELTHTQIWHYIERYRRSLKAQEQEEKEERSEEEKTILKRLEIQKVQAQRWKRLTDELETTKKTNIELEKRQAVHDALREKENPNSGKVGLIRWLVRKLY